MAQVNYLTFCSIGPVCQCDDRGKQVNNKDGDWCWFRTTPCKLLTNTIAPSDWTWARCVHNGVKQIECDVQVGKYNRQDGQRSLVL